ncbi:condensation domain-containing protein [Vibrio paucivorans]
MKHLASSYEKAFFIDSQTEAHNVISNTYLVLDIEGELKPELMQKSIAYGFSFPCFHYQYKLQNDQLYKELKPYTVEIPYFDFSNQPCSEQSFQNLLEGYYQDKLVFDGRPLFRGAVCKMGSNLYKAIIMCHHICLDGTGFQIFFSHIREAYQTLNLGQCLVPLHEQLALDEYAVKATLSKADKECALHFWQSTLNGAPSKVEFDHVVYPNQRQVASEHLSLGHQLSQQVKSYCRKKGLTTNMFFKGLYALLVSRMANQSVVTVTSPMDRRTKHSKQQMGCFVNTRLDVFNLETVKTLDDYWLQIKQFNRLSKAYGDLPYMELVRHLKQYGEEPELMVNNVAFGSTIGINNMLKLDEQCHITQNYSFIDLNADIQLLFCESSQQSFNFRFDYLQTYVESGLFTDFLKRLKRIIDFVITEHPQSLASIPLLEPQETLEQRYQGFPEKSLAQLVHQWVVESPATVAMIDTVSGEAMSYRQLHRQVSDVAHYLAQVKSQVNEKNACVAINLSSLSDTVITILATQYLGIPFTCVDCSAPMARQQSVMKQLSPMALIGEAIPMSDEVSYRHLPSLEGLTIAPQLVEPAMTYDCGISQYIFTSGTTGQPKAVALSHRAFVSTLHNSEAIPVGQKILYSANEAFDAASLQLWLAFLHGRTLVIPGRNEIANPESMERLIKDYNVDHMFLTTGLFETYMSSNKREMFNGLETLVFGGDAVSKQTVERGLDCNIRNLINIYGPTETTIYVTSHRCSREDLTASAIPIGKPRPNAQVWVVDNSDRLLGPGMVGHIIVTGDCISEGYVGVSSQNDKFCDVSINRRTQRAYRTGDYGYYREDGVVVFRGRKDDQIKLRGYRIELAEIRQALEQIPEIQMAAVILKKKANGKQLLGYYQSEHPIAPHALRKQLNHWLPSYMVPTFLIHVESMPLNRNGKLDRHMLPEPDVAKEDLRELTELQRTLLEQACDVLELPSLSLSDDFVSQGGDSISAILLSVGLEEKGMRLSTSDIMKFRCFDEMAEKISISEKKQIMLGEKQGSFNLLPAQRWFFEQNFAKPEHFNQAVLMKLPSLAEFTRLSAALTQLTQYHDCFWLRFKDKTQQTFINKDHCHFELKEKQLANWEEVEGEIAALNASFELNGGPLMKALLLRISEESQPYLYLCAHHLVVDGVSWRRISTDLQGYFEQGANFQPAPYSNTQCYQAHWELFEFDEKEVDYWLSMEANASTSCGDVLDSVITRHKVVLTESQTNALLGVANQPYGTNSNELLISALYRVFSETDRAFSLLIEGHGRKSFSDTVRCDATVGWFTSIFPLCLTANEGGWAELIKTTKQSLRSLPSKGENYLALAYGHAEESVRKGLQAFLKLPVSFNFLGRFGRGDGHDWQIEQRYNQQLVSVANKPFRALDINAWVSGEKLCVEFEMLEGAFNHLTVAQLGHKFHTTLLELVEHCNAPDCQGGLTPCDLTDLVVNQKTIESLEDKVGPLEDIYTATEFQRELLYFNRVNPDYQIDQLYFELEGELDQDAFRAAWTQALIKHDILRSGFDDSVTPGLPLVLVPRKTQLPLIYQNWEELDNERQLEEAIASERQRPFDWHNPPLLRLLLARTSEKRHFLLFTFHHVLFDGWSMQIFLREIREDYERLVKGEPLNAELRRFSDFPRWLSAQPKQAASQYWAQYLCDAQMNMRVIPDCNDIDSAGLRIQSVKGKLKQSHSEKLRQAAINKGATLNQFCQFAWAATLSKYADSRDIVFGTTLTKRPMEISKVTELVGLFVATPPLRIPLEGSISNMVQRLNENNEQRMEHAFYDLNHYDEHWRPTAPFGTLFVFENYPEQNMGDNYSLGYHHLGTVSGTNHQIVLCLFPGEQLEFSLFYDSSEISAELAKNIIHDYQKVLTKLIDAERAEGLLLTT